MIASARSAGPDPASGNPCRIIYLSQLFDPEPTFKGLGFIKALRDRGIEAEVVTGFPNYPGGKVYPGHRIRPLLRQRMDGVEVTRLAMYPSHDQSAVRRILCYLSFFFTSLAYLLFRARRADLIYVYYPSLTAGLAAVAAKLFRRTPIVLDIQDMWPDSLGASGMMKNPALLAVVNFFCGVLYRGCDHIIVLSPGFRSLLIQRGVPAEKVSVIYNWAEETALPTTAALPAGYHADDGLRLLFAGNMGAAQGLEAVLQAAALVQKSRSDVTFLFMGGGTERPVLEDLAGRLGLTNTRFLPRVPLAEVQAFLAAADCLLVHLKDEPLFRITIPSKTQAYLYAGRPILMAVRGDAADLVLRAAAGLTATPEDPADLAAKVLELAAMNADERAAMGARGRSFYHDQLSARIGIDAIAAMIRRFRR
ncbi:glycosyltransferase family 4 protein [Rhodobacter ferrooxidans]|uniref:Glycosyl transferase group 1 n=1 Tax=Rhodobacter ferrooxidans TaxID=371731 RepID=C8RWV9_9RHOB|nr:glycosyltransferase family 4 protein [Rhodobacter sp. SW2]EEW27052.1 glycosyl transferase group 1 [Rhodobacter sp. SW2]